MKDQYVGDINDYFKYSVLRALGDAFTASLLVCWMLTNNDGRADGGKVSYLRDPQQYRAIDPELFDLLRTLVARGERSTEAVELSGIVPGATFFRRGLEDGKAARDEFLGALWRRVKARRVVFFDPDNGLGVASVPCERAGSRRYLYCSDLRPLWELDAAAVVYQHFPRVSRAPYVAEQLARLTAALPGFSTLAIYTSHVALLVATPRDQLEGFEVALRFAAHRWAAQLQITAAD